MSYERYNLLFRPSEEWQFRDYGFHPDAMGDCLSYTADESVNRDTTKYIETIADLLIQRKRWPDVLQWRHFEFIAVNRFDKWWSDFKYKRGWIKRTKYRPQKDMTRDPFVYFYYACYMLKRRQFIEVVKVRPRRKNRPTLYTWRRYLITGKEKHRRRYVFWEKLFLKLPRREFAWNLVFARCVAAGCTELLDKLPDPKPNKG